MEFSINILIGIFIGIFAGVISGIIVARISKFEEIRNQVKRIIWSINYIYISNEQPKITAQKDISELIYLSSDFFALKHVGAGNELSNLRAQIGNTISSPPKTCDEMEEIYTEWQNTCRNLKPSRRIIFKLDFWV